MVLVDRSLRGSPLSPPNSLLWGLRSCSGLPTVVLHTINPSAPPWWHAVCACREYVTSHVMSIIVEWGPQPYHVLSASSRAHKNGWLEEECKIPNLSEFTTSTKNSNTYAQPCVDLRHVAKHMPGVLFLVWFNYFDWLWAYIAVTRSSSSRPFLCALGFPQTSS